MFIVTRRHAESVIIDGFNTAERALKVTVLEVKDGRVRLSFEVNKDVSLQRAEVWENVRAKRNIDRSMGGA
ncbi:MAG: carbon storage regulator [Planctomycetes bacterium]|nr:carbon storage regulator [Planctomycetota bacterium]